MIGKRKLFLIAGVIWLIAGFFVFTTGIKAMNSENEIWVKILSIAIFFAFYYFIFRKIVKKHFKRIMSNENEKMMWYNFFDKTSYIVMAIMMGGGLSFRLTGVLPEVFVAFFYTGLGAAIFSCGIRFVLLTIKRGNILK